MADNDIQIVSPIDENFIICPRCKTVNPGQSNFCLNCGNRLRGHVPGKPRWEWLILLVVFLAAALIYYYPRRGPAVLPQSAVKTLPSRDVPIAKPAAETSVRSEPAVKEKTVAAPASEKTIKIPVGTVVFKDITGRVINEMPAAVVAGGWLALPRRLCLGAASWILKLSEDRQIDIVGGMIGDEDPVGLWRIDEGLNLESPDLYPWIPDESLSWLSLGDSNQPQPVTLQNTSESGYFMEAEIAPAADEMGLLLQNERVVGWSFGDLAAGVYLWSGDEGGYLRPEIQVDDFYRITFAGGREEAFLLALAMPAGEYSELERLEALAGAFRYETRLSAADTSQDLSTPVIIENIRTLMARTLKRGEIQAVADIFDVRILTAAADSALLLDVARATVQAYGFEAATVLTESVASSLRTASRQETRRLNKFFSDLYRGWINTLLKNGDLQGAWQVYGRASRQLPDDAAIHLQAVELALVDDDWQEAQRLLEMRSYPAALDDKIKTLRARIARLKGREGKIVIHFTPGTRLIPVDAVVNHEVHQKFIVDTGASMVTIPRVTARQLDLVFDERTPLRRVNTAGGVQYAREVTLAAITIEGRTVSNIKALVLDLPDQAEWGLLGLNFLHRFHMDMNTEEGVLLLEPR